MKKTKLQTYQAQAPLRPCALARRWVPGAGRILKGRISHDFGFRRYCIANIITQTYGIPRGKQN